MTRASWPAGACSTWATRVAGVCRMPTSWANFVPSRARRASRFFVTLKPAPASRICRRSVVTSATVMPTCWVTTTSSVCMSVPCRESTSFCFCARSTIVSDALGRSGCLPRGPVALGSTGQARVDPVRLSQKFKPPTAADSRPKTVGLCLMQAPKRLSPSGRAPEDTCSLGQGGRTKPTGFAFPRRRAALAGGRAGISEETSAQQAGDLQLHARPHGRAQADFLDVASLGARRLGFDDRAHESLQIFDQRFLAEAGFADPGMNQSRLFGAEFNLPALGSLHRLGDIVGDRTQLRVRHQAAGA